ncbi:MAG: GspH/FimT family pseudopilin [Burkholderiales bacterium]
MSPAALSGYTLIEMLVVMMILGLLIGLISSVVRMDGRDPLQTEAERLAQLLNLAAAESRLTGRNIRWTAEDSGYRFWRRQQDQWMELRDNDILRPRKLPEGIVFAGFRIENRMQSATPRLDFMPHGLPLAYQIGIVSGSRQVVITALPFGEAQALDSSVLPDVTTLH